MLLTYRQFIETFKYVANARIQLQNDLVITIAEWEANLINIYREDLDNLEMTNCTIKIIFL